MPNCVKKQLQFLFFIAFSLNAATLMAQDFGGSAGNAAGNLPPQGNRSNNRGGFKITATGQCLNENGQSLKGAVISILVPTDTASIGKRIGIYNANINPGDAAKFRAVKPRIEEGMNVYPNDGFTSTDSSGNYLVNIPLRSFMDPNNPDFMAFREQLSNPKSKYLTFLIVAIHPNGTSSQQWINLHEKINLSLMPPPTGGQSFIIPTLTLIKDFITMDAVEIKTQAVTIKGDTTEMNAGSFKVNPDASAEDLVSKMPGVTTSNGQIQAQGEQVKKVLVDGKPFFGDDPNAALKNLPAEVVNKIQIFDGKSEQSLFSGIDDGNTVKTMNIVTKSQFRNGMFGRGFAGYGRAIEVTDVNEINKYKGGITLNSFNGNRRISFLSQTNNINEQNFSFEDLMGSMGGGSRGGSMSGGGGRGGMGGMGSMGNFFTGSQSGITTTQAAGVNYSNIWGKTTEVSGSYFFNRTVNNNDYNTNRTYITGNQAAQTQLGYVDTNQNKTNNNSHRFNARFSIKLDSSNSLIIEPRFSLQNNSVVNPLHAITFNGEVQQLQFISDLINNSITNTNGYRGNASILWRHSFDKKGRTLSAEINPGANGQTGSISLNNTNTWGSNVTKRDQKTNIDKLTKTFSGNVTFTESLDSNHYLAATIATNINQNNNDRLANLYDALSNQYNLLDTLFSSKFVNGYTSNKLGVSYRYQTYKWNVTASLDAQLAELNGTLTYPKSSDLNRKFTSVLPGLQAKYNMGKQKNIRLNYSTSNNAPSIDQLQPVTNNNNVMQLSAGNPLLVQDYQHSFFVRFFSVVPESGQNKFFMINAQLSNNYISNKTILGLRDPLMIAMNANTYGGDATMAGSLIGNDSVLLAPGAQITLPVNMNGYYNLRMFGSWGKTIKKLNVNGNAGITVSHIPSMIQMGNGPAKTNMATNPSANAGLVLASNISEKIDFNISGNASYSQVINSIQQGSNQTYMNYSSRAAINWMPNKKWVLNSDVTMQKFTGLSSSFNQSFYLWNAGLGYKFMKNNAGELRLSGYDLLNQNRSIQRNVTQTYYEDVKTKVLNRYVMLTFTYKLRKFNAKGEDGKEMKMMFPGGMPPPGMPGHGMGGGR